MFYNSEDSKVSIPQFPEFNKIEFSAKDDIEMFIKPFPPYSDFNFTSLYSWDIDSLVQIAQLNGNLVVKFCDYLTGKPFLSFTGGNRVTDTACALIEYSKEHFNDPCLKLVPETVALLLCHKTFTALPDRDAFDYIYSVKDFCEMHHWPCKYKTAQQLRTFIRDHSEYTCRCLTLNQTDKDHLRGIYANWASKKGIAYLVTNEYKAFERILQINGERLYATIICINNAPTGFILFEILANGYSIVHFAKANTTYKGTYEALYWHSVQILSENGVNYINFEQDLGIENLRKSKGRYKLHGFLKKFTIQTNL